MNSEPLVSAIVPIYNVKDYLEECLESLGKQTITSLEILMIDDGSTDCSSEIARKFAVNDPRFIYFRKENGGLGQARNYGIDRARGKYICFCDSDDVIPPDAYKSLYLLAEKYGCDFVSGDVERFDSKGSHPSSLHRIAYRNACELMNVHTHPELLFDSIAPNKLFRRSFFNDTKLRFPEGMYYEDIPVITPMYCITNKFAHLNQIVYSWRLREDDSTKSITQRRTEWSNFSDRFKAMKMVDGYFEAHIKDKALFRAKDYKWLRIDLRIYVDALNRVGFDYRTEFMDTVVPYIAQMDPEIFTWLNVKERIKYHYLMDCDLESLMAFLPFSKTIAFNSIRLRESNGRYYGKFPFQKLSNDITDFTRELQDEGCKIKISKATFTDTCLRIEGEVFFARISAQAKDNISVSADMISTADNSVVRKIPASITKAEKPWTERNYSTKYRVGILLQRTKTHYVVDIPFSVIKALPDGGYYISLNYSRNDLACPCVYLAWPTRSFGTCPLPKYFSNKRYYVSYDPGERICLHVEPYTNSLVDEITVNNETIIFRAGCEEVGSIAVHNVAVQQANNPHNILPEGYYYNGPTEGFALTDSGTIHYMATPEGLLDINLLKKGLVVAEQELSGTTLRFKIHELVPSRYKNSWQILLVGEQFGVRHSLQKNLELENGYIIVDIDFSNQEIANNLPSDTYHLELKRDAEENHTVILPIYAYSMNTDNLSITLHGRVYSTLQSIYAGVEVKHQQKWYESTARRRQLLMKYVYMPAYKLMRRVLPIKKNMVLFESYWGKEARCNPGGMYRYLSMTHPELDLRFSLIDERTPLDGIGKRIKKGSMGYLYSLARAHILFNNVNFEDWYEKRPGQIEVQTTHGTPLKKIGFAATSEFTAVGMKNFAKRCERWDYLISPGPETTRILRDNYRFERCVLETGFPRNDYLFTECTPENIARLKERYHLSQHKKLVLYAPTWRKANSFNLALNFSLLLDSLEDEYEFALRVHHFSASALDEKLLDSRVINLTKGISMEECFLLADILITDYSSLMFDYALLDRPLLFFAYDLDDYRDNLRGFNFDFEAEAPGPILSTTEEVLVALKQIDKIRAQHEDAYRKFVENYCLFEQGTAAKQIYQQVFNQTSDN